MSQLAHSFTGTIVDIFDTVERSEKFRSREFVIQVDEEYNGNVYSQFIKMQMSQSKCEVLDNYGIGQQVTVSCNIRGVKWVKDGKENYFNNLDCWKLEAVGAAKTPQSNQPNDGYRKDAPQPAQDNTSNNTPVDFNKEDPDLPF